MPGMVELGLERAVAVLERRAGRRLARRASSAASPHEARTRRTDENCGRQATTDTASKPATMTGAPRTTPGSWISRMAS